MPGTAAEVRNIAMLLDQCHLAPCLHTAARRPDSPSLELLQCCKDTRSAQGFKAGGEGWFREVCEMWPGQGLSLKVKEVLLQERSKFQVRSSDL